MEEGKDIFEIAISVILDERVRTKNDLEIVALLIKETHISTDYRAGVMLLFEKKAAELKLKSLGAAVCASIFLARNKHPFHESVTGAIFLSNSREDIEFIAAIASIIKIPDDCKDSVMDSIEEARRVYGPLERKNDRPDGRPH